MNLEMKLEQKNKIIFNKTMEEINLSFLNFKDEYEYDDKQIKLLRLNNLLANCYSDIQKIINDTDSKRDGDS